MKPYDTKEVRVIGAGGTIYDQLYKSKKGYTFDEITKHVNGMSKKALKRGWLGKIQVAVEYPWGWRSSKFVPIGSKIKLYDPQEQYGYDEFDFDVRDLKYHNAIVSVWMMDGVGGCIKGSKGSKYNDCLYEAIQKAFNYKMINKFSKPWKLKRYFKLEGHRRLEGVPVSCIDADFEKQLKCNINIVGDVIRQSKGKFTKTITIKLTDGHYTLKQNEGRRAVVGK